jgi:hypothetical protein
MAQLTQLGDTTSLSTRLYRDVWRLVFPIQGPHGRPIDTSCGVRRACIIDPLSLPSSTQSEPDPGSRLKTLLFPAAGAEALFDTIEFPHGLSVKSEVGESLRDTE